MSVELYVTDIETILINSLPTDSSSSGSVAYIMNNDGILIAVSDSSQVYQYTTSTLINTVDSLPLKAIESSNKLISSSSSYLRDNYLYKTDNSIVSIAVWCVCVATITILLIIIILILTLPLLSPPQSPLPLQIYMINGINYVIQIRILNTIQKHTTLGWVVVVVIPYSSGSSHSDGDRECSIDVEDVKLSQSIHTTGKC